VEKPVPIYSKKYLKLQRKRAAALAAKAAAAGVSVNEPLRKGPAMPASAEALAEYSAARKAMEAPGEPNLKRARLNRAEQQLGVEMIKSAQSRGPSRDPRLNLRF
jgi:hypothetical protein